MRTLLSRAALAGVLAGAALIALPAGSPGHTGWSQGWPALGLTQINVLGLMSQLVAPAPGTVPKADCLPGDKPETALQGQSAPLADQLSGRTKQPYYCNVRLVGQTNIYNRGNNLQMAWADDCAYVASASPIFVAQFDPIDPRLSTAYPAGLAVIDASDPANPKPGPILRTKGSADSFETLTSRDTPTRKIIVAGDYEGAAIDIYDATEDCTRPKLMATYDMPHPGHNLRLSHDGTLLYATVGIKEQPITALLDQALMVIDLTDMANPRTVGTYPLVDARGVKWSTHEVDVSKDGSRLYAAATTGISDTGHVPPYTLPRTGEGSVLIYDSSDFAERRPNPQLRFISAWKPEGNLGSGGGRHSARVGHVGGRTILVAADELGDCLTSSWPHIADITDERHPTQLSEYKLQVHDPANCPRVYLDFPGAIYYGSHYNEIDDSEDTRLGLFPMGTGGLRIADLRDPAKPKEIGYYVPGANPGTTLDPGLIRQAFNPAVAQFVTSYVRYRPETGHIWFTSWTGGLHIVEISRPDVAEQFRR